MALKQVVRWMRSMTRSVSSRPGVYVPETTVQARSINGVETGVAAFVGAFALGPAGRALNISSLFEFERDYGGAHGLGEAPRAVLQFFLNGGSKAILVRVPSTSAASIEDGLRVLRDTPEAFDLLCLPDAVHLADRGVALYGAALAVCTARRALLLVDTPVGVTGIEALGAWLAALAEIRSPNAALYYPRLKLPDGHEVGASGSVAGIIARADFERGVWKAPAGPGATITGAALDVAVTTAEQERLTPQGINVIRVMGSAGPLVWGARTLSANSEWRYVPVRRAALYLERSLERGLAWTVFEPNDEPLWAAIRQTVDGFMESYWRDGALVGAAPKDAWFTQCGRQTTTEADLAQGRVRLMIGFAPVKPSEFTILRLTLATAPAV